MRNKKFQKKIRACLIFSVVILVSSAVEARTVCESDPVTGNPTSCREVPDPGGGCSRESIYFDETTGGCLPPPASNQNPQTNSTNSPGGNAPTAPTSPGGGNQNSSGSGSRCEQAKDDAEMKCRFGLSGGEAGMAMQAVQMGGSAALMSGSGAGQKNQCDAAGKLNAAMGLFNGAQGYLCKTSLNECKTTCESEREEALAMQSRNITTTISGANVQTVLDETRKYLRLCNSFEGDFQRMLAQVMSAGQGFLQSKACSDRLAEFEKNRPVAPTLPDPVKLPQPQQLAGCQNPANAGTKECVCAVDKNNPICGNLGSGAGNGSVSAGGGSKVDKSVPTFGSVEGLTDETGDPFADFGQRGPGGPKGNEIPQGGGGGPQGFGGSGAAANAGNGKDEGGPAPSAYNANVIQGVTGAGGAFNYGKSSGGAGANQQDAYLKALRDKFNLGKYLPKAGPQRGLAGMASGKDGVTGALGPTIWQKVSSEYEEQKPTLINDGRDI